MQTLLHLTFVKVILVQRIPALIFYMAVSIVLDLIL